MNDNKIKNKEMSEEEFEVLFRQAVIDHYNGEIKSLLLEIDRGRAFPVSPEFDLRMKKLFDSMYKPKKD